MEDFNYFKMKETVMIGGLVKAEAETVWELHPKIAVSKYFAVVNPNLEGNTPNFGLHCFTCDESSVITFSENNPRGGVKATGETTQITDCCPEEEKPEPATEFPVTEVEGDTVVVTGDASSTLGTQIDITDLNGNVTGTATVASVSYNVATNTSTLQLANATATAVVAGAIKVKTLLPLKNASEGVKDEVKDDADTTKVDATGIPASNDTETSDSDVKTDDSEAEKAEENTELSLEDEFDTVKKIETKLDELKIEYSSRDDKATKFALLEKALKVSE